MNYTKNYHLPQWVSSDRIMMEDFNDAMSAMEDGMTASTQTANTALSAANAASQTASAAKLTADAAYSPSKKPYAVGSYVGSGSAQTKAVNVGFRPAFLIISGQRATNSANAEFEMCMYSVETAGGAAAGRIQLTATGFQIPSASSSYYYPDLNETGRTYDYIAFR